MEQTIQYINSKINGFIADTAIILGSGLGDFADMNESIKIPYAEIPGFKQPKVEGHRGMMVFTKVSGKNVIMMQGRYHFYEGYSMADVTYPVKVLKKLGVKNLIITNAAGGVNDTFGQGILMLIKDHLNLMGTNPLIGTNDDTLGPRFPDMSEVYKKDFMQLARNVAKDYGIQLKQGVYAAVTGPSYETPSEVKMLRQLGVDAVGMSTVPEAIVANWAGMRVLGISCITNYAAGITINPLSHAEVVQVANKVKDDFIRLLVNIIKEL